MAANWQSNAPLQPNRSEPVQTPPAQGTGGLAPATGPGPAVGVQDLLQDPMLAVATRMQYGGGWVPALGGIPLLAKLGQGGMGAVYYGIHPRLETDVAVKVLSFHLAQRDAGAVDRFKREARLAAKVRSPHLVGVYDVNQEGSLSYLVLEFVNGASAGVMLRAARDGGQAGLPESTALDICIAATTGLAAAHAADVVHRDIKPDNIMIPRSAQSVWNFSAAKLSDLGLARAENTPGGTLTGSQACMGTPGYMSPEQTVDAHSVGKPSDVFSLGATLYALLAGRAPFTGSTSFHLLKATVEQPHLPIHVLRADVSAATARLLDNCLAKDPRFRYADGNALLQALLACRAALAAPTAPTAPAAPAAPTAYMAQVSPPVVPARSRTDQAPQHPPLLARLMEQPAAPSPKPRSKSTAALFAVLGLLVVSMGAVIYLWATRNPAASSGSSSNTSKSREEAQRASEFFGRSRMAANETAAAAACKAFAEAEEIYRRTDWDTDGVLEYAVSLKGDYSLLERTEGLGDLMLIDRSFANAEASPDAVPKAGYFFKVLTAQGPDAAGGRRSYMSSHPELTKGLGNPSMTLGYALVAYPAKYNVTGRDTFIINSTGTIFQTDLGEDTEARVMRMTEFNPTVGIWVPTE